LVVNLSFSFFYFWSLPEMTPSAIDAYGDLYTCPVCEKDYPDGVVWIKIITQRQTNWCPEEGEYICRYCYDRIEESKAQDRYEDNRDYKWLDRWG
jgi:hypothetical protein